MLLHAQTYVTIYLYVYPSIHPFTHLSVCPSIHLSIYPSGIRERKKNSLFEVKVSPRTQKFRPILTIISLTPTKPPLWAAKAKKWA